MDYTMGFGPTSKATFGVDFSKHLTLNGRTINTGVTPTITATRSDGGSTSGMVSAITATTTAVLFKVDASTITGPDPVGVTLVITPTYDNADTDPRWKTIQVTAAT